MAKNLVIFDGSNFYHKAKHLAPQVHLSSFNYSKFAESLTNSKDNDVEYCVGEVKPQKFGDAKAEALYAGQQKLFYQLGKQSVVIKKGFMMKTNNVFHEKGVDVRIATDVVQGELTSEGSITIEGQVTGTITTRQTVAISDKAKITADVSAESAVIGGEVQGHLTISKRLVLLPTAKVAADIHCPTLKVEEGALYTGRCHMAGNIPFVRAKKAIETLSIKLLALDLGDY